MRKSITILFAIMLFAVTVSAQKTFSNIWVKNSMGQKVAFSSLLKQNTPTILIFWGSTCASCSNALETIDEEFSKWKDECIFQVIAVSTDDVRSTSKAKSKASARGWTFTIVFDENQDLKRAMHATAIPQFIVLDGDGTVVYSHLGYTPGTEEIVFEKVKTHALVH